MRKPDRVEEALNRLAELRTAPRSPDTLPQIRGEVKKALGSNVGFVIAKAALVAGEFRFVELLPELTEAFERCLIEPLKSDRGCLAKNAIADALLAMEWNGPDVFLKGARHVQMEPVYGGSTDTASELRGKCAIGLTRSSYEDWPLVIVDLLVDKERAARAGALRALSAADPDVAGPLLRLFIRRGEPESDVLCEAFSALLLSDPERSVGFVKTFLDDSQPEVAEAAALAFGDSRLPGAFEVLKAKWESGARRDLQSTLLIAIATHRSEPAFHFLLNLIRTGTAETARAAVKALDIHQGDARIATAIAEARAARET